MSHGYSYRVARFHDALCRAFGFAPVAALRQVRTLRLCQQGDIRVLAALPQIGLRPYFSADFRRPYAGAMPP